MARNIVTRLNPPIRFSRLKLMERSPLHYLHGNQEETVAMERGSAVHSIVFGGPRVIAWHVGRPRRGKEYEAFAARHPDANILTASDYAKSDAMAKAVGANRLARKVFKGAFEVERNWKIGSRACAGRIDVVGNDFLTELKCTASADPTKIMWQAFRMGWAAQLAWYADGLAASGAPMPRALYIVAVEQDAPHAVTVMKLTPRAIDHGRRMYRSWFERVLVCESADKWPAYSQTIVPLDIPDPVDFMEAA